MKRNYSINILLLVIFAFQLFCVCIFFGSHFLPWALFKDIVYNQTLLLGIETHIGLSSIICVGGFFLLLLLPEFVVIIGNLRIKKKGNIQNKTEKRSSKFDRKIWPISIIVMGLSLIFMYSYLFEFQLLLFNINTPSYVYFAGYMEGVLIWLISVIVNFVISLLFYIIAYRSSLFSFEEKIGD